MASRGRRRKRGTTILLTLVVGTVAAVAFVRRQRLHAATRQFHERHGPPADHQA